MKILIYVFMILAFLSCGKEEEQLSLELPECIESIILNNQAILPLKTVKQQQVDGEIHYWLNTDARHFDGPEYIVNSNCDTVCFFCGECFLPACLGEYGDDWQLIWEQ